MNWVKFYCPDSTWTDLVRFHQFSNADTYSVACKWFLDCPLLYYAPKYRFLRVPRGHPLLLLFCRFFTPPSKSVVEHIILQELPGYFLLGSCCSYDLEKRRQFFFLWKDCSVLILTYLRIRSPTIWQNNGCIKNHPWDLGDVLEIHKSLCGAYLKNKDRTCRTCYDWNKLWNYQSLFFFTSVNSMINK